ncbi:MAG: hypothetical protein RJB62_1753 [Pseudomonadota bacterium]|jgi:hypothetical protein
MNGCRIEIFAVAVGIGTVLFPVATQAQDQPVPDFSGYWARAENPEGRMFHPMPTGPSPVMVVPDANGFSIGDHTNPILQPHAAEAVLAHGNEGRAGNVLLPAWSLCWPSGVPLVVNMAEPVQFLQSADHITILYQRDMQVRRIHLNAEHPDDLQPIWYGDSVGHYEGRNTLVVDTVGQNNRALIDRFGTPRSESLHVVERYTINEDRSELRVEFTVTDPETFTTPWSAHVTYRPVAPEFGERICAENNKDPDGGEFPIPKDEGAPDF